MSHIVLAFTATGKSAIVFQGTLEACQAFQWSSKNADALKAQGYTDWKLVPKEK
jgi:hypothetical protein